MRGDKDLREIDFRKLRYSRRALMVLMGFLLLTGGILLGWYHINHPPKPWLVRWQLDRYLAKHSRAGAFKVDFPFPSKAEMAKTAKAGQAEGELAKGARTGKDFDSLREDYFALKTPALALERTVTRADAELKQTRTKLELLNKEMAQAQTASNATKLSEIESNTISLNLRLADLGKATARRSELAAKDEALAPVVEDLWAFQKAWIAEAEASGSSTLTKAQRELARATEETMEKASSYEAMYHAIGQELFVAKRLLASGNPDHRRLGVTIALTASRHALDYAMNGSVAARICDGYILPNLDLATDRNPRSTFNEQNLLGQCADIFRRNLEYNSVVRTYEIYLAGLKNAQQADWARSQIAMAYEQAGDPKQAVAAIRSIQDTNSYRGLFSRIPRLQQDVAAQGN